MSRRFAVTFKAVTKDGHKIKFRVPLRGFFKANGVDEAEEIAKSKIKGEYDSTKVISVEDPDLLGSFFSI